MKILLYCSTVIFFCESVLASATADIVTNYDKFRLVRRVEPKKRPGARSVPPNGRMPLSRETKYREEKKQAAMDPRTKLERSKSVPSRPNPVISDVAGKEGRAGKALKDLRDTQKALRPDTDRQLDLWDNYMRGHSNPAATYQSLQAIGERQKGVIPHHQALTEAYTSAGKASMDAGLTHRAMRNKLKAGSASAATQMAKDDMRYFNSMMVGHVLQGVAMDRMKIRGTRDRTAREYMKTASRARGRIADRREAFDLGQDKLAELRKAGGHDSESDGYDSEESKLP